MWFGLDFLGVLLMAVGDGVFDADLLSECERRNGVYREIERKHLEAIEKAESERILVENYLASLLSGKTKKKIRQAIESDTGFWIIEHMGLGLWVRNQLRKAGFRYDDHVLDGVWFGRLLKAVYLPKGEIKLPRHLRMRLWKMRFRSFITHALTKWIAAGVIYAILLTAAFMAVPSYPAAIVLLLVLVMGPPGWIAVIMLDRFS